MLGLETASAIVVQTMGRPALGRIADRMSRRARADRRPGRARARRWRRRPRTSRSSTRPSGGRSTRPPWPAVAQHPLRRDGAARSRRWPPSCAASRPCSTERRLGEAQSSIVGTRGRPHVPRRGLRQHRGDLRRGGVQHRHDRLPGDADRPVVPPAGRRADRAAHRQHRRQRRGRRVRPDLGRRLRGARPVARPSSNWRAPAASRTASRSRASSASAASTPGR